MIVVDISKVAPYFFYRPLERTAERAGKKRSLQAIVTVEGPGIPAYRYGVILNYLFRVDQLDKTLAVRLPLYRVHKKIRYRDLAGHEINPDVPNAFKYETLALDVVRLQESCLAHEVDREKEFAPVKNAVGVDSVETARALLRLNGISL